MSFQSPLAQSVMVKRRKTKSANVNHADETSSRSVSCSKSPYFPLDSKCEVSQEESKPSAKQSVPLPSRKSTRKSVAAARSKQPGKAKLPRSTNTKSEHQSNGASDTDSDWKASLSDSSSTGSSEDFVSTPSRVSSGKNRGRKANLSLFSEFTNKRRPKRPPRPINVDDDDDCETPKNSFTKDLDDEDDWEDVAESPVEEIDYMQSLLKRSEDDNVDVPDHDRMLSVAVPTKRGFSKKAQEKDAASLERLEKQRALKKLHCAMHTFHVVWFLTYCRSINSLCDTNLYRALGLSIMDVKCDDIYSWSDWDMERLDKCIQCLLCYRSEVPNYHDNGFLVNRLGRKSLTHRDCVILLVAALRAIGLDVRLIVGFNAISLNPSSKTEPIKVRQNIRHKESGRKNRKIISSSEEEEEMANIFDKSGESSSAEMEWILFCEVYLPTEKRWVLVDLTSVKEDIHTQSAKQAFLYVVGATTTNSVDSQTSPYFGRNPVDLSARYDPNWSIKSRAHRLPSDTWLNLLQCMRKHFDRDAVSFGGCIDSEEQSGVTSNATRDRDVADENSIRSILMSEPIPTRMQDFKNHPTFALQRHLLKFEVIYPPDAPPMGFFRNEPVYSRDCVQLCHTRESWLKEAKVSFVVMHTCSEFSLTDKHMSWLNILHPHIMQSSMRILRVSSFPPLVTVFCLSVAHAFHHQDFGKKLAWSRMPHLIAGSRLFRHFCIFSSILIVVTIYLKFTTIFNLTVALPPCLIYLGMFINPFHAKLFRCCVHLSGCSPV